MLAIYIIAALLAALFLLAAYRSMGRGAIGHVEPRPLLEAVCRAIEEVTSALDAGDLAAQEDRAGAVRAARRRADGCTQALERVDVDGLDPGLAAVRDALRRAGDELGWASRLMESPGYDADGGIRVAAAGLRDQARGSLAEARSALGITEP